MISEEERELIKEAFGKILKDKRMKEGLSQEELAFRSGLHRTYAGSVERGERNLSLENIFVFARALNCHAKDLIPDEY
jgi:transcriptional regulator with XRE-family HTH domain